MNFCHRALGTNPREKRSASEVGDEATDQVARCFLQGRPLINKPPPLNRDYNRDPSDKAPKRRRFINQGSTLSPFLFFLKRVLEEAPYTCIQKPMHKRIHMHACTYRQTARQTV